MEAFCKQLVKEEYIIDSRRCSRIYNKKSGNYFDRNLEASAKWEMLYQYAAKNPDEFECDFDREINKTNDNGDVVYDMALLKTKTMPELQKIAKPFGVTGRSKEEIISRILKAQGE